MSSAALLLLLGLNLPGLAEMRVSKHLLGENQSPQVESKRPLEGKAGTSEYLLDENRMILLPNLTEAQIESMKPLVGRKIHVPLVTVEAGLKTSEGMIGEECFLWMMCTLLSWMRFPTIEDGPKKKMRNLFLKKLNKDILRPVVVEYAGLDELRLMQLQLIANEDVRALNQAVYAAFGGKNKPVNYSEELEEKFLRETVVLFGRMARRFLSVLTDKVPKADQFLINGGLYTLTVGRYFELRYPEPRHRPAIQIVKDLDEEPEKLEHHVMKGWSNDVFIFKDDRVLLSFARLPGDFSETLPKTSHESIAFTLPDFAARSLYLYANFLKAKLPPELFSELRTTKVMITAFYADVMVRLCEQGLVVVAFRRYREQLEWQARGKSTLATLGENLRQLEEDYLTCWRLRKSTNAYKTLLDVKLHRPRAPNFWDLEGYLFVENLPKHTSDGVLFDWNTYTSIKKRTRIQFHNLRLPRRSMRLFLIYAVAEEIMVTESLINERYLSGNLWLKGLLDEKQRKEEKVQEESAYKTNLKEGKIELTLEEVEIIGTHGKLLPRHFTFVANKVLKGPASFFKEVLSKSKMDITHYRDGAMKAEAFRVFLKSYCSHLEEATEAGAGGLQLLAGPGRRKIFLRNVPSDQKSKEPAKSGDSRVFVFEQAQNPPAANS